jgi:hypothetical protein
MTKLVYDGIINRISGLYMVVLGISVEKLVFFEVIGADKNRNISSSEFEDRYNIIGSLV